MFTQTLAGKIVLQLDRAKEADVGRRVDITVRLNLVKHQGEERPETLELNFRAGRLDQEVRVSVSDHVLHAITLGIDLPDAASRSLFFTVAVGLPGLRNRLLASKGGTEVDLIDLFNLIDRQEELLGDPLGSNEALQLTTASVENKALGLREIKYKALIEDGVLTLSQFLEHQLHLLILGMVLVELGILLILDERLKYTKLFLDVRDLLDVFRAFAD